MDLALRDGPYIDASAVAGVLAEVAEIASETLELKDVFGRVANSIRRILPFDHMGVIRIVEGQWAVKHATTLDCAASEPPCAQPCPLTNWSPRLRPRAGPIDRIDDAPLELDPGFPGDAAILDSGVRSTMWEPFRIGDSFQGGVWLCSKQPSAFSDDHQLALRPIAAAASASIGSRR